MPLENIAVSLMRQTFSHLIFLVVFCENMSLLKAPSSVRALPGSSGTDCLVKTPTPTSSADEETEAQR